MMLSRKTGPPVPPRPSAAAVASALSKGRPLSPVVPLKPHNSETTKMTGANAIATRKEDGRTVVYKSPSRAAVVANAATNENIKNNNNIVDDHVSDLVISLDMSKHNVNNMINNNNQRHQKTDVYYNNSNNNNTNNNNISTNNIHNNSSKNIINDQLIKCDNLHSLKTKLISPVAKPRLNLPIKKLENNTIDTNLTNTSVKSLNIQQQQQQHQNIIEITSNQQQQQQQQHQPSKQVSQPQQQQQDKPNLINTSEFVNMNNHKNNRYNNNNNINNNNNNKINDKSTNIIVSSTSVVSPVAAVAVAAVSQLEKNSNTTNHNNNNHNNQQQQQPPPSSIYHTNSNQIIEIKKSVSELEKENNMKNHIKNKLFTEIIINATATGKTTSTPPPPPSRTLAPDAKMKSNANIVKLQCRSKIDKDTVAAAVDAASGDKRQVKSNGVDGSRRVDKKVEFHEMLISELAAMRKTSAVNGSNNDISKDAGLVKRRERYPSDSTSKSCDTSPNGTQRGPRIRTSDWIEVGDNGKEVILSSCHISLEDSGLEDEEKLDDASSGVGDSWDSARDAEERINMSLPGLPPLPKSLSGFDLTGAQLNSSSSSSLDTTHSHRGMSPVQRKPATLDTQLAILKREMYGLRQLDLSLLSQLWALNESIQEFRSILQEQETLSPPSPTPSNSEANSSSEDEDDSPLEAAMQRMRVAPPPPPSRNAPSRPV